MDLTWAIGHRLGLHGCNKRVCRGPKVDNQSRFGGIMEDRSCREAPRSSGSGDSSWGHWAVKHGMGCPTQALMPDTDAVSHSGSLEV